MILTDGELLLRPIEVEDSDLLYTLINDPQIVASVVGWSGPVSRGSQSDWIQSVRPLDHRYVIEYKHEALGTAHIDSLDLRNRSANLNLKILPNGQGRGLGRRTVGLLVEYLFLEVDLEIVTAGVLESNLSSNRLFESCGFLHEATLRDRIFKQGRRQSLNLYSITQIEWQRLKDGL